MRHDGKYRATLARASKVRRWKSRVKFYLRVFTSVFSCFPLSLMRTMFRIFFRSAYFEHASNPLYSDTHVKNSTVEIYDLWTNFASLCFFFWATFLFILYGTSDASFNLKPFAFSDFSLNFTRCFDLSYFGGNFKKSHVKFDLRFMNKFYFAYFLIPFFFFLFFSSARRIWRFVNLRIAYIFRPSWTGLY